MKTKILILFTALLVFNCNHDDDNSGIVTTEIETPIQTKEAYKKLLKGSWELKNAWYFGMEQAITFESGAIIYNFDNETISVDSNDAFLDSGEFNYFLYNQTDIQILDCPDANYFNNYIWIRTENQFSNKLRVVSFSNENKNLTISMDTFYFIGSNDISCNMSFDGYIFYFEKITN